MFIVGNTTDQITSLIWGYLSSSPFTLDNPIIAGYSIYQDMFNSFTQPWMSNEPLFFLLISLLGSLIGPNAYNFYLLLVLIVNFVAFWYAFKNYKYWWLGALVFNLSPYYYLHLGIHPDLIHIWALPLFYKLYTDQKYKLLPFFVLFATLFSNYIGFVLIILMCTLVLSKNILMAFENKLVAKEIYKDLLLIFAIGLLLFLFLFRFFALNYFKKDTSTVGAYVLNRTVNDFTIFSARPWYFFIPSEKNPILGNLADFEHSQLSKVNNYLFHQYYAEEHVSLFLGFTLYIALLFALLDKSFSRKTKVLFGLNLTVLFIAMLPPEITLKGQVIYLPSYFIYKAFPVFRVTTRLVLALHILTVAFLMEYFEYKKNIKHLGKLVGILTLFILIETFIPVKMRTLKAPTEYLYIAQNTEADSYINVYPYSKAREALLWLPVHQRKLANVPGVFIDRYNSEVYTENMFNPDYPILNGYFLVSNDFVGLVPKDFRLVESFVDSKLYFK